MNYTIYYEDKFESLEDIATKSRFLITEYTPYDDCIIESTFENGLDLIEYMDTNKLLIDNKIPFVTWAYYWNQLAIKYFSLGV